MLPTNRLIAPLSRLRRRIPNQTRITRALCMQQMHPTLSTTVSTLSISGRTNIYTTGCADDAPIEGFNNPRATEQDGSFPLRDLMRHPEFQKHEFQRQPQRL